MTVPAQIVVYENFEFNKVVDNPSGIGTTIATMNPLPKYLVPCMDYIEQTGITTAQIVAKDLPAGIKYEIIDYDKFEEFRQIGIGSTALLFTDAVTAYDLDTKQSTYDLAFAKKIAHRKRRNRRYSEFAPNDSIVSKSIPGSDTDAAEASRAASTIDELYAILQKYPSLRKPSEALESGYTDKY